MQVFTAHKKTTGQPASRPVRSPITRRSLLCVRPWCRMARGFVKREGVGCAPTVIAMGFDDFKNKYGAVEANNQAEREAQKRAREEFMDALQKLEPPVINFTVNKAAEMLGSIKRDPQIATNWPFVNNNKNATKLAGEERALYAIDLSMPVNPNGTVHRGRGKVLLVASQERMQLCIFTTNVSPKGQPPFIEQSALNVDEINLVSLEKAIEEALDALFSYRSHPLQHV